MVPIEKWGDSPSIRKIYLEKPVKMAVIQHTVTPECASDEECEKILNNIRKFQTEISQFDDIAQS